jgi:hypothetical protein
LSDARQSAEPLFTREMGRIASECSRWISIIATIAWGLGFLFLTVAVAGTGRAVDAAGASAIGVLVAAGTVYAVAGLTLLLMSFVLFRLSRRLRAAYSQKSPASLTDAMSYENAFWWTAAGLVVINAVTIVVSLSIVMFRGSVLQSQPRRTVSAMRKIGAELEEYARTHHSYPEASSIDALIKVIDPRGRKHLPRMDGWGRSLDYSPFIEKGVMTDYRLSSPGGDGSYEKAPKVVEEMMVAADQSNDPKADFVFGNGHFIIIPARLIDERDR